MKFAKFFRTSCLLLTLTLFSVSCTKKAEELAAEAGGTGGSGSTFSAASIAKAWTSGCIAKTDSRLGTSYYKILLTLQANGSFFSQTYMYVAPSGSYGTCSNADYNTVFTIYGKFTVGDLIPGSSDTQYITFNTANSNPPSVSATGTSYVSVQNAFNNDCGGTSPYCNLSGGTCTNNGKASGAGQTSSSMTCMNYTFPLSTGSTIYNVGTFSNGVLTMGAAATGAPGVYNSGAIPSTATIPFN